MRQRVPAGLEGGALSPLLSRAESWAAEAKGESERLREFRRFILLYGAVRAWLWFLSSDADAVRLVATACLASGAAALAFHPRWQRRASLVALVAVASALLWRFPYAANHLYLELLCVVLLCLDGGAESDGALVVRALRWLAAVALFQTGLQKVLYGHYWRGDFLAFMVGSEDRFARAFRWLLPDAEVARLVALDRTRTGAGPYRVPFGPFVVASASVVVAEMAIPVLLLVRRTRRFGAIAGLGLMVAIQAAALELGFALLFVNLLVLFLPSVWSKRALWASAAFWIYSLAAALGWLPGHPADWNGL